MRDYAQVKSNGTITRDVANEALQLLDVDQFGLDDMDSRILRSIIEKFDGGPVGINTIAAAVGEDASTIEEVYEPFLVQNGFLQRTPRGRDGDVHGVPPLRLHATGRSEPAFAVLNVEVRAAQPASDSAARLTPIQLGSVRQFVSACRDG